MVLDHSETYRDSSLRNLPHRKRLGAVFSVLEDNIDSVRGKSYADVGCANGYITELVAKRFGTASVMGFDHQDDFLGKAREYHPDIRFGKLELTEHHEGLERFELVTCLETIEHIGPAAVALDNLIKMTTPGGLLLVTAPIEVGWRGVAKFFTKTIFYGYKTDELPGDASTFRYALALVTGRRMSRFRDDRPEWDTHFGFDYRDIDDILKARGVTFEAFNRFTTRFYLIRP